MIVEAMDSSVISVTTENIFPDGKMQQNSTGDAVPSGLLSLLKSDEKVHLVHSRYLGPSMASCHDYCKYGKKHDSEATSRDLKAFLRKKFREREQDHLATPCVEERRTRTVIKPKMETESKSESDSSEKSEFSKPKSLSLIKKNVTFREKKSPLTSQYNKQNQVTNLNQDDEKKTKVIKRWIPRQPKSSPDKPSVINLPSSKEGTSGDPDMMKGDTESISEPISSITLKEIKSPCSEAGDSGDHCIVVENTKAIVSEPTAAATPKAKNQKTAPSVKQQQKIKQNAPLPIKHVDVAARSPIVLKTKTPLIRSLSRRKSSRNLIAQSNKEKKLTESLDTSRFGGFASEPANNLRSKAPHLRSISQLKPSISQFARRNQEKITKSPDLSEIGEDNAAPADTLKTRSPEVKSVSKLKPSWSPSARRNQESKITKSPSTSNIIERKLRKVPPSSFDGVSSLKPGRLSSLKHAASVKTKDKVWRINSKKKPENSVSGRDHENECSKSATNESSSVEIEGNNMIEGNTKIEVSRGHHYKREARKTSTVRAEENTPTTYRLKYRQRKAIDLRSDSIGARRLWFKIGKMAAENPNSSSLSRRRSFKKKNKGSSDFNFLNSEASTVVLKHQDVDEEAQALFRIRKMSGENPTSGRFSWRKRSFKKKKDMESSDSKLPNSNAQIVVLKHQDAEKKEAQALLNHVIEETASKLVETRKSKVKALVGAFETVISLQESKPASAV